MAKITLNNLTSNYGSQTLHNTNSQAIEDELNNKVLYRDNPAGEPNQMENAIDMNSNDILNANAVDVKSLVVNGELVVPTDMAITTLPDQAGHAGKFLTTNATTASWAVPDTAAMTHAEDATSYSLATYLQNRHVINVKDFGAVGDGVTNDTAAITAALAAAANGILVVPPSTGSYVMSGLVIAASPVVIKAHGAILEWKTDAADQGFKGTSNDVKVEYGTWKGPQFASHVATQIGIWFEGVAPSTYLTGCSVTGVTVSNWGGENIRFRMCQDFSASYNIVKDGRAKGINVLSCLDGGVSDNIIYNFLGDTTPEAWGITCSKNGGDITTWPQTKRVSITDNKIRDILDWTGIDTHGGEDLTITGNIIRDCLLGITITRFDDTSFQFAPKNVTVVGNTITNENIAKATVGNGIQVVGASSSITADSIVVTNNTITGYGRETGVIGTDNFAGAIYLSRYSNVTLSDNIMRNSGSHGLYCDTMGTSLNGSNNTISGLTDATTGSAIFFDGDALTAEGRLEGTIIDVAGFTGVHCLTDTNMDMINTKFVAAATNWDQTGGVQACQFLGRVDPVHIGTAVYDPPSIAADASDSTIVAAIPGCSAACVVADIGVNRDLQGMAPHTLTADTDTNEGSFTYYLYNNTSGAIDLASLNILYKIIKPV